MGTQQLRPFYLGFDVINAAGLFQYAERLKRAGYYFAGMNFVGKTQANAARAFKDFSPLTLVSYRPYPDRDLPTRFPDPKHFYQWVDDDLEGDTRIAAQVMNEVDLPDEASFKFNLGWVLSAIPASTAAGRISIFWNWGVGHPVLKNAHELLHPYYVAMQGKEHLHGVHEYAFAGGAITNSLIGRIREMWEYCLAHGLKPLRSIGTEGGLDKPGFRVAGITDEAYINLVGLNFWNEWWSRYGMIAMELYAWGRDGESGEENDWGDYNHAEAGAAQDHLIVIAPNLHDPAPIPDPNPASEPEDPEPEPTGDLADVLRRLTLAEGRLSLLELRQAQNEEVFNGRMIRAGNALAGG